MPRKLQQKVKLSAEEYALAARRYRLCLDILCALPGCPTVYYGDEAGMTGGPDPYCRGSFPWGREAAELTRFLRFLTEMYRTHPVLRGGEYEPLSFGNDVLGCRRWNDSESVVALVNRSRSPVECFGVTVPAKGWVLA